MTQVVEMLLSGSDKWSWLTRRLVEFTSSGSVLIFVTKKTNSEELATNLTQEGYSLGLLHGDMDQSERNKVISDFKKNNMPVLVATDVAGAQKTNLPNSVSRLALAYRFDCFSARGLDIPSIRTVVNYDVARDIDTHTHRIGRTGRAGEKGVAYTLLTSKDSTFAGDLVRNLEGANQAVSKELMDLAMQVRTAEIRPCRVNVLVVGARASRSLFSPQNPWFRKSRFKAGKGKRLNIGGGGLGYKERPGLGAESSVSCHFSTLQMSQIDDLEPQINPVNFDLFIFFVQERSSSSSFLPSSYESYSKPTTGALGERVNAMRQAFQVELSLFLLLLSIFITVLFKHSETSLKCLNNLSCKGDFAHSERIGGCFFRLSIRAALWLRPVTLQSSA